MALSSWPLCGGALYKPEPLPWRANGEKCTSTLNEAPLQGTKPFTSERVLLKVKSVSGKKLYYYFLEEENCLFLPQEKSFLGCNWQPVGLAFISRVESALSGALRPNNKLENTPQTSAVFYLARGNYFSVQSICNWHWLNKKLQPWKALFIISCESAGFTVDYPDKGLRTINTAQGIAQSWQPGPRWREDWKGSPPLETPWPFHYTLPLQLRGTLLFSLFLYLELADAGRQTKRMLCSSSIL